MEDIKSFIFACENHIVSSILWIENLEINPQHSILKSFKV